MAGGWKIPTACPTMSNYRSLPALLADEFLIPQSEPSKCKKLGHAPQRGQGGAGKGEKWL